MLVATGQMAATVFPGAGAHDTASAKLIVEEAGGKVTDVFGNEQRYDQPVKGAIFSNGVIHSQLVVIVRHGFSHPVQKYRWKICYNNLIL